MASHHQDPQPPSMSTSPATQQGLFRLPLELLTSILPYLPNRDLKNLRLTSKFFLAITRLRLDRVFLSANPRDVEVFRAIANHETFRKGIVEIIWDDSRFPTSLGRDPEIYDEDLFFDHEKGYQLWFEEACESSIFSTNEPTIGFEKRSEYVLKAKQIAAILPLKECWSHYGVLQRQQEEVIASGADRDALVFGLTRFPSLKRVNITPAAHGRLFSPLYETPTIRSFPYGFNYPIPRGWPVSDDFGYPARSWIGDVGGWHEEERNKWRGFRIIMDVLANHQHRISEFIMDVRQLYTGLNCRIFDELCMEYLNFVTLLRQPNFSRIDLALLVGQVEHDGWRCYRSGLLRGALGGARDLKRISMYTNMDPDLEYLERTITGRSNDFVPLRTIFPIDKWVYLQHFGLSRFIVELTDLLSFLTALPPTLRSVELSFLQFLGGSDDYPDLLRGMRNRLNWHERPAAQRPTVSIGILPSDMQVPGLALWIDAEVYDFLYNNGTIPFGLPDGQFPNQVPRGKGVVRDSFDPSYEHRLKYKLVG